MPNSSFRDALGRALLKLGEERQDIVVVTPDLAKAVRINDYKLAYPQRFVTVGISEADCIGVAAGLAAAGLTPVVVGFAMFVAEKPFEQIRNSVAYPNLNVKIIATHGGLCVGRDGATHQATEDLAIMRFLPNFTVLAAADASQTSAAIRACLDYQGPTYLRLGRDQAEEVYAKEPELVIGRADTLREGNDVALIACGTMVAEALRAADELQAEGICARVVNMHTLKPLDEKAVVQAAMKIGAVVTAEDHSVFGGLGSAVAEVLVRLCPTPMEQIGVRDCFAESGSQDDLYAKYGLTGAHIASAARRAIARKSAGMTCCGKEDSAR